MSGGCSAGWKMSNADPVGNLYACQFWGHVTLGNVRRRKFSEIWRDANSAVLEPRHTKHGLVKEKCALRIHPGVRRGIRLFAEAVSGEVSAGAPACSLTGEERPCLAPERA